VVLLAHAPTAATRRIAFPGDDEPVEAPSVDVTLPRVAQVVTAPALRCRGTAEALGLRATVDAALAGCDHGRWTGHPLDEIATEDPAGMREWLTDPDARPHDGETAAEFVSRIGRWLDGRDRPPSGLLAVVDPSVVRAVLVHVTGASATAMRCFDVAPLALAVLTGSRAQWSVRELRPADRAGR
jgi:broad specificity phosphatase PhoE